MLNKKFERKHLILKPGCFNSNIILQPRITQAQREKKLQKELKLSWGPLTKTLWKQKKLNTNSFLETIVLNLNLASNIYEARDFIKNKNVTINKKIIDIPTYSVKPFSQLTINKKELNFIKTIKKQKVKNKSQLINTKIIYK